MVFLLIFFTKGLYAVHHLIKTAGKFLFGDHFPVEPEALPHIHQMRGGEKAGPLARCRLKQH